MPNTIDYYFDFSSPYGYLGSQRIEQLAERHGRTVDWRPFLLGAVFQISGQQPMVGIPMKGSYALRDFERSAREWRIPYRQPSAFPIGAVQASRVAWWLKRHEHGAMQAQLTPFVHAVFKAYYVDDRNIKDADTVVAIAEELGLDGDAVRDALGDQVIKNRLREEVDAAIDRGVFGSPFIFVDDEPFWGHDRIEQVDRWLERGGW